VDQTHLVALHAPEYPHMALRRPVIGWERTSYGAKISMHVPGVTKPKLSHWVFPSHTRHTTARRAYPTTRFGSAFPWTTRIR
jgi:hypothetical protein